MNLHKQIEEDLKAALKTGEKEKASVLRLLISSVKNIQIEKKIQNENLPDEEIISILKKQVKQRRDSISAYQKGGRADLAEKEEKELRMLENYLPAQADENEIEKIVEKAMSELGVSDISGFGKIMGYVMKELQGKSDGDVVKKIVEKKILKG